MRIVKGFQKAKPLLTRKVPSYGLPTSPKTTAETRGKEPPPEEIVKGILAEVRTKGDRALFSYTRKFDGAKLSSLEVSKTEISDAYKKVDKKLVQALKLAANRIKRFHFMCKQRLESSFLSQGLGRQISPLNRVGIYVPGGTDAYPSTVLMTAIPARLAGVKEIIVVTPPEKDGTIPPATLVAADIAGVNRIFKIGGAQAIAALAFGTESVPNVDKICGPGNVFVVTAKKMAYGTVGIESLPGPSEIIIVADATANASFCAADTGCCGRAGRRRRRIDLGYRVATAAAAEETGRNWRRCYRSGNGADLPGLRLTGYVAGSARPHSGRSGTGDCETSYRRTQ